jgi:hypothetical protein
MWAFEKTKERISQSYYWPNMEKDSAKHIEIWTACQERRFQHMKRSEILMRLPNQGVHMDLFGPLQTTKEKKLVMCMTDGFTNNIEVIAVDNKVAETVTAH